MWWLFGLVVALFILELTWSAIQNWMKTHTSASSSHVELIKEKLASGNFRVVAGVFSSSGKCTAKQAWEADKLDDELRKTFGGRRSIKLDI